MDLKELISTSEDKMETHGLDPYKLNISIFTEIDVLGKLTSDTSAIERFKVEFEYIEEDEGEFEKKTVLGNAQCLYLDGYSVVDGLSIDLRDLADSYTGDLLTAVDPVTNRHGNLNDYYFQGNILYIDKFFIKPEYRGKGIGQIVFPLMINTLARGAGVITTIPSPTEDDGSKRIDATDKRYKKVKTGMIKFIEKFGFEKVDKKVWAKNTELI